MSRGRGPAQARGLPHLLRQIEDGTLVCRASQGSCAVGCARQAQSNAILRMSSITGAGEPVQDLLGPGAPHDGGRGKLEGDSIVARSAINRGSEYAAVLADCRGAVGERSIVAATERVQKDFGPIAARNRRRFQFKGGSKTSCSAAIGEAEETALGAQRERADRK